MNKLAVVFLVSLLAAASIDSPEAALAEPPGAAKPAFHPGQEWPDDRGKFVESHLGGFLYEAGTYYWYGMNFDGQTLQPGGVPNVGMSWMKNEGVTCYSSKDLYHWKFESVSLRPEDAGKGTPLWPFRIPVRPKVLHCDKTGKYVMMMQLVAEDFHAEGDTAVATFNHIVVATADKPQGPFTYHSTLKPPGGAFDLTMYKDDDGRGYLIVARDWAKAHELSDDFLTIVKTTPLAGVQGEAPAIFKHDGYYYCLTSELTGWDANLNKYAVSKSLLGPYTPKGRFPIGPGSENTFGGQTTAVIPVAGKPGAFIFVADRLNSHNNRIDDFRKSTHIWLPIELDAAKQQIQVRWRDAWDLSAFEGK